MVVTNYLWRPLLPTILEAVEPGGVLLYETFAQGNETVGKPSRPDFLLRPGELLALCSGADALSVVPGESRPHRGRQAGAPTKMIVYRQSTRTS